MTESIDQNAAFVFERAVDAPLDLVWKAWTDADALAQWWGPQGFTIKSVNLDLRPEGRFHYCMLSPDGQEMWGRFVYKKIEAPERLDFVVAFSDENGGILRHPFSPDWPAETLGSMVLAEKDGKTMISSRSWPINATQKEIDVFKEGFESMEQGYSGTLDRLDDFLAREQGRKA
jgi:uncharacterized protein YndB with AHSA1/START domain